MAAKIHRMNGDALPAQYCFHCPGCQYSHGIAVAAPNTGQGGDHVWGWNGSLDAPTFTPSILCNKDFPDRRCHSFVADGKIQFLQDCWHSLAGKTVEIPDWED